jgi:uncharacterized protein
VPDPAILAVLLVAGLVVGFLAGLLGIGGGMLLVPVLSWVFAAQGLPPHLVLKCAIATSLATILFTSVSSIRAHHAHGAIRWPIAARLAPGLLLGALLGAQVTAALPARPLAAIFAAFIGWSAWNMWRDRKPKPGGQLPGTSGLLAAGGVIGALSALLGAGGAFLSVPFMVRGNVPVRNAVATSAALGLPIAAAGAVGYVLAGRTVPQIAAGMLGYLHLPALLSVAATSMLSAPLGARTAHRIDTGQLKRVFAVLLALLAASMLHKAAGSS